MKKKKIQLTRDQKEKLTREIIEFFYNKREEEIGELAATLILDFITDKVAPVYYNEGVKDSIKYISERVEDMYGLEV
ncbi:MAG: DUF2164 domain-containing protein [Candidatus Cloacimonetes bacterium]|nr:DUF2164 domain-containing protein [Candidatus Cloacimonadota bacterium]